MRFFCKVCGSAAFSDPGMFYGLSPALFGEAEGYTSQSPPSTTPPNLIPPFGCGSFRVPMELKPQAHLHYGSSCLFGTGVTDGTALPLFKDTPKVEQSRVTARCEPFAWGRAHSLLWCRTWVAAVIWSQNSAARTKLCVFDALLFTSPFACV